MGPGTHKKTINMKVSCTHGKTSICSSCSKIKMVVLLKNGYDHLKHKKANGTLANPVHYSYLQYNKRNNNIIVEGMERRLLPRFEGSYNKVHFYNNIDDTLIKEL